MNADHARVVAIQELRRSAATTPRDARRRPRTTSRRQAIAEATR